MKRVLVFAYGLLCYLVFLAVFVYLAGFVGSYFVPHSLDSPADGALWVALLVNAGLVLLFGLQHSIMARPAFKKWWTQFVPESMERSTYVLFSSLALIVLLYFWRPMGGTLWNVTDPAARIAIQAVSAGGWGIVLLSTFLINHFDLFGLRQVWLYLLGKPYTKLHFKLPLLYRFVRHPLYLGFMIAFWATPTMTVAHLLFAVGMSAYILVAIRFEERDLVDHHGQSYEDYRKEVPMLVPRLVPKSADAELASKAT